jgi:K+-sensing histidine kinase KdpD
MRITILAAQGFASFTYRSYLTLNGYGCRTISSVLRKLRNMKSAGYFAGLFGIAAVTLLLVPIREHANSTTIALGFLLVVLFVAILWGSRPALLASVLGMLCFNFFFLPPFYTFTIADYQNWVALTVFFITALAVGQLSARAKRRAEESEAGRREINRLYEELQDAFERASEAEAFKRSERLKSALLDAVTHDLRTPLTSIMASSTLLLEDRENPSQAEMLDPLEQKALLRVITQASNRLNRFVESMVDLARIEAGDMTLHRNWGAVDEIIEAALTRAEPLTEKHQIRLLMEEELPVVRVDARAVTEVVYTLVDNATKYAPAETTIVVKAHRVHDEIVEIAVEDEGPGIPLHLHEKVFERFFRATDNGTDGQNEFGFGMGLAIARGIVEAHSGKIWVEDGLDGHGTRVVFTVPVGDDEQAPGENGESTLVATANISIAENPNGNGK